MSEIGKFYFEGGVIMHFILLCGIAGLAVTLERVIFLYFRYNINAHAFMAQIQKLVMGNNIDRAIKLCNAAPTAALARVVKAGLTRANKGEREIHNALEEAVLEVVPLVQKRITMLLSFANLATLMGLVGTVFGLIGAFKALATVSADKRQEALGLHVSVAMNTTAFGLAMAIGCLLGYIFVSSMATKIVNEIDLYGAKIENLLCHRLRGTTPDGDEAGKAE